MPLDFYQEDECCGPALNAAILAGLLEETDEWTHQECGQEWKAHVTEAGIRYWKPSCYVEVIR